MKKYFLDILDTRVEMKYCAGSKWHIDMLKTFQDLEFDILFVRFNNYNNKILKHIFYMISLLNVWLKIEYGSIVFVSYPLCLSSRVYDFLRLLKLKKVKVSLVLCDIDTIRFYSRNIPKVEISLFNTADNIIVHTDAMGKRMIKDGVTSNLYPIEIFDYYFDENSSIDNLLNNYRIVFAGNLNKSEFLSSVTDGILGDCSLLLYGVESSKVKLSDKIKYCGKFPPNDPSIVKGDWGLVWDGDSIHACSGLLGEYLRINSPHKFSLYMAIGIPVIVWKESGLSEFVREHNIGISINSLEDISSVVQNISEDDYKTMKINVKNISAKVQRGGYLKAVLDKIEKESE